MGVYYVLVNVDRGEYLDASPFGEDIKAGGLFRGLHGVAFGRLVCDVTEVPLLNRSRRVGSWCGSRVIAAGDDIVGADGHGVRTADPAAPGRNLHQLASEEYEDVTYAAMDMLCSDEMDAAELAERAPLEHLGNVVLQYQTATLDRALVERHGSDWRERYAQVSDDYIVLGRGYRPWNAVWTLPPAQRFAFAACALRAVEGPAWAYEDALRIIHAARHARRGVACVEAWAGAGPGGTNALGRPGRGRRNAGHHSVVARWEASPLADGEGWQDYAIRTHADAAAALQAMHAAAPAAPPALRFFLIVGCQTTRERRRWPPAPPYERAAPLGTVTTS